MYESKLYWTYSYFSFYVTRCISISALVGIPIRIMSSAIGLNICVITAEIKKYKSIMKKLKKKHNKVVFLAKTKLNSIEVLISKSSINWYISHDEFASVNNVLKEFDEVDEIGRFKQFIENFSLLIKQCYCIVWISKKIQKVRTRE